MRNANYLLGWRGIEKERQEIKSGSVLSRPVSQDQLTVSVMLGFSLCCFSKVALTDFYSSLHFMTLLHSYRNSRWTVMHLHTSFRKMESYFFNLLNLDVILKHKAL